MKYLVTGGAGFIGSHIAEALVKKGETVRIFDNLSTGDSSRLASFKDKIDFCEGDLRNPKDLEKGVKGIDIIFHQAALRSVPRSVDDPLSSNEVNINGTLNLLMAARQAKVQRIVYASSSSVYGDNKTYPQNELMRQSPLSPYAVSKLAGELYGLVFSKTFGVEFVGLRYFNVFGPRQNPESQYAAVIPKFMESMMNNTPLDIHWDGKQSRDFTYIDNVVHGNWLAAHTPKAAGETFNLACGDNYSLLDIIRVFEKITGKRYQKRFHPKRAGDVRKTWADISKAKKILRFKPLISFEAGLKLTWDWFSSHYR